MAEIQLNQVQARVVACLVEKAIATPKYYPMTVNAITQAANQKSSRQPVMQLSEGDVGNALLDLEEMQLAARDETSSRATKWRHRFQHQLLLQAEPLAILTTLMLRGPQTEAELRARAAPIGGPNDSDDVLLALADLEDRAQPLVKELARAPGQQQTRYAHLLCGEDAIPAPEPRAAAAPAQPDNDRLAQLEQRVAALEARLAALE